VKDVLVHEVFEDEIVNGKAMPVEGEEHHISLDVRMNLRQLAQKISRVTAADVFQALEVHRVFALENIIQRLRDHRHARFDLWIAHAQQFLNFKVGGDAQLIKIDEF